MGFFGNFVVHITQLAFFHEFDSTQRAEPFAHLVSLPNVIHRQRSFSLTARAKNVNRFGPMSLWSLSPLEPENLTILPNPTTPITPYLSLTHRTKVPPFDGRVLNLFSDAIFHANFLSLFIYFFLQKITDVYFSVLAFFFKYFFAKVVGVFFFSLSEFCFV